MNVAILEPLVETPEPSVFRFIIVNLTEDGIAVPTHRPPLAKSPIAEDRAEIYKRLQASNARLDVTNGRRRVGPEEVLVVLREVQDDGTMKHDYNLSNASFETTLDEFARVAKAEHRIDELCAPYAAVIDIDRSELPSLEVVSQWDGAEFVAALRHDPTCNKFNPRPPHVSPIRGRSRSCGFKSRLGH